MPSKSKSKSRDTEKLLTQPTAVEVAEQLFRTPPQSPQQTVANCANRHPWLAAFIFVLSLLILGMLSGLVIH
jgi:hypothetical protein